MTSSSVTEDGDRAGHDLAFAHAGIALDHLAWDEPADWPAYDLVVLRSPWDYSGRLAEFLPWLDGLEGRAAVQNPVGLVRWNIDKRYLGDLSGAGLPVVATVVASSAEEVDAALAAHGTGGEVVVKPTISAGSRHTGRFAAHDPRASQLAEVILAGGASAMIQPSIPSVAAEGEVAIVLFDGQVSHAVRKGPILELGGGLLGGSYQETIQPVSATAAQVEVALAAARWVQGLAEARGWLEAGEPLLYARYDLVRLDDGSQAVLEAELFEPSFFLESDPAAPRRFVEAVARRIAVVRARR